jgi:FdhD protein
MKTTSPVTWVQINSWKGNQLESKNDLLAVEEPLQIKLQFGSGESWKEKALTVTMRTPVMILNLQWDFYWPKTSSKIEKISN